MAKTRYELFEQGLIRKYKDVAELAPEARQMGQKAAVVLKEPGWSPHNIRDIYLYGGGAYVSYYVNPTEFKGDKSISFASGKLEGEDKRPLLNVLYKMSNLSALVSNLQSIIIFVDKTKGRIRTLEEGNPDAFYVAMPDGSYSCSPSDVWNGIGGKEYVAMLTKTSTCNDVDVRFVDISDGFFTFKAEKGIADDKRFLLSRVKAAKLAIAEDINRHFFVPLGVDALNMRLDGDKHVWAVVEDAVRDKTSTFKLDDTANAKISKLLSGAKAFDTDAELKAHIVGNRTFTAKTVETVVKWNGRELNSDFVTQFGGCLQAWTSNTTVYPVDAKLLDTYEQEVRKPYDALCYATAELQRLGLTKEDINADAAKDTRPEPEVRKRQFELLKRLFTQLYLTQKTATADEGSLQYTDDATLSHILAVLCTVCAPKYKDERKITCSRLQETQDTAALKLVEYLESDDKLKLRDGLYCVLGFLCKYYLSDQKAGYSFVSTFAKYCTNILGELTAEQQCIIEQCIAPVLYALIDIILYYVAFVNYIRIDIMKVRGVPTLWLQLRNAACTKALQEARENGVLFPGLRKFRVTSHMRGALVFLLAWLNKEDEEQVAVQQLINASFDGENAIFIKNAQLESKQRERNMKIAIEIMKLSLESKKNGGQA